MAFKFRTARTSTPASTLVLSSLYVPYFVYTTIPVYCITYIQYIQYAYSYTLRHHFTLFKAIFLRSQTFVYDSERDAFDFCNQVTGHLPAGSSTVDYVEQLFRCFSAVLDASGLRVPIEKYPIRCRENAECLPIYKTVVPLQDSTSELSAHLFAPQSPRSASPHHQRSKSPTKSSDQQQRSPSPTVPHTTSTYAASTNLAQLPDVIGDDGGYEDAFRPLPLSVIKPSPPSKSPVFEHNSSDIAGAIQQAAASVRQHRERQDSSSSANVGVNVKEDTPPARSEEIDMADVRNAASPKQSSTETSKESSQESHQHM